MMSDFIRTWRFLLLCTASYAFLPVAARAQDPQPLQPRIEAGGRIGTERNIGVMEGWMPLVQGPDRVLYSDIRWMVDDNSDQEGNLGIGYRQITNDKLAGGKAVIGGHGWIDRRRTDRGSNFYQVTVGGEYLKEDWDVKANAYIPLNKEKTYATPNAGTPNPYLAGTGLFVDTNGQLIEEAQPGLDLELGYRIPIMEKNIDSFRVYGGGYGFKGDETDDVIGGRVRASVDINPLLNVGARFQYDEPRGGQAFIEATLRFPFTAKKRFQQDKLHARLDESPERDIDIVTNTKVTDTGLRKEVINTTSQQAQRVLHVDNTAAAGGNGSKENPFNTLAAAQAVLANNDVLYVHRGDGTVAGQNQGFVIDKNNVQMIGSGADFVYDRDRFTTRQGGAMPATGTIITAATLAPLITNNQSVVVGSDIDGTGISVTGNDAYIAGVDISQTQKHNIFVNAVNGATSGSFTIHDVNLAQSINTSNNYGLYISQRDNGRIENVSVSDVNFTGTLNNSAISVGTISGGTIGQVAIRNIQTTGAGRGVFIITSDTGGNIDNVVIADTNTSNGSDGVRIDARGGALSNVLITNATAHTNSANGINIVAQTTGTIRNVVVNNSDVQYSTNNGINVAAQGSGRILSAQLNNNVSKNNTRSGALLSITGNGFADTVTIDNNEFTSNGEGNINVSLNSANALLNNVQISNNTVTSGTGVNGDGIKFSTSTAGSRINAATIDRNIVTGNNQRGISIISNADTQIDNVTISNNTIDGNGVHGLYLQTSSAASGISNTTVTNNTMNNNAQHGMYVLTGNTGVNTNLQLNGNTTSDNALNGVFVYTNSGTMNGLSITNHTSHSNDQHGIYLQSANSSGQLLNARIQDSVITDNGYNGLHYVSANSGILTTSLANTVVTGNGLAGGTTYYGVRIDHDSTGTFNVDLGGGTSGSVGGNSIYNNVYRDVYVDSRPGTAAGTTGLIIAAQYNWWGVNTGLNQATRATFDNGSAGVNGSRINTSNHLTTAP